MIDDRAIMLAREAHAHLGAALSQIAPTDDQIIIDHLRQAERFLISALKVMKATQS